MMSLCSRTFYFFLSSSVINVMTTPSNVTNVTVKLITSNPNFIVLKIGKCKIIENKIKIKTENKINWSSSFCFLTITLYGFQLWFYNRAPITYYLKALGKMQRRAAIWILEAFKTFLSYSIEAITGLIPI